MSTERPALRFHQFSLRSLLLAVTALCVVLAIAAVSIPLAVALGVCALGICTMALGKRLDRLHDDGAVPLLHRGHVIKDRSRAILAVRTGRFHSATFRDEHPVRAPNLWPSLIILAGALVIFYSVGMPWLLDDNWPSFDEIAAGILWLPAAVPNPGWCVVFWMPFGPLLCLAGGWSLLSMGLVFVTRAQRRADRAQRFLPPLFWAITCWGWMGMMHLIVAMMFPNGIG